jgi:hypothetical protein
LLIRAVASTDAAAFFLVVGFGREKEFRQHIISIEVQLTVNLSKNRLYAFA